MNAPKEVAVHREEIYDRIKREQETSHVPADNSQPDSTGGSDEAADLDTPTRNTVAG